MLAISSAAARLVDTVKSIEKVRQVLGSYPRPVVFYTRPGKLLMIQLSLPGFHTDILALPFRIFNPVLYQIG